MINEFYKKLYQKNLSSQQLMEIMQHIYGLQANLQFSKLDKILSEVNIHRMDDVIIVALLRSNFNVRGKLIQWNSFLAKVNKTFTAAGKENLLVGLISREE